LNACVALTGRSTIDQHALFLLGLGSSGKSNLMKITQAAIECYFKEIAGNIFTKGNRESSKLLNTYSIEPYIRVLWINELSDTKMDGPVFKRFCDGDNQTVRLYSDGCFTFKHHKHRPKINETDQSFIFEVYKPRKLLITRVLRDFIDFFISRIPLITVPNKNI